MELILATHNAHKLREVSRTLRPYGLSVVALPDGVTLPPEDGVTFAANALPKARTAALALGRAAIADDSGIEAAALDGQPGVRSARYAGEHATDEDNLAKLLREVPPGSALRYVCALAYVVPGGGPLAAPGEEASRQAVLPTATQEWTVPAVFERVFHGTCEGRMASVPAGEHGFGYDPVFIPVARRDDLTIAQLTDAEKDAISHRGGALRAFAAWLVDAQRTI